MNKVGLLLALPLLVGGSQALAASTVELTTRGLITPTACTPSLSAGGMIDYGKISQQDLNLETATPLPSRTFGVSVNCEGSSRFALRMTDNREGTATVNSEIFYGLGLDKSGNKIGFYAITVDPNQTVADALPQVYGTESTTGGLGWSSAHSNRISIGARSYVGFSDTRGSTSGPVAIQNLSSTITIETTIRAKKGLDLSADIPLDGSAILEVVYL